MASEVLCLRAFGKCVRPCMNKISIIKTLGSERKFVPIRHQETRDAFGINVFYSLLMESLSYSVSIDGIPDIFKTQTTCLKTRKSYVPSRFVEVANELAFTKKRIDHLKGRLNAVAKLKEDAPSGATSLRRWTSSRFTVLSSDLPIQFLEESVNQQTPDVMKTGLFKYLLEHQNNGQVIIIEKKSRLSWIMVSLIW